MANELIVSYKRGLVHHPEESFTAMITNDGKIAPERFFQ
jgi:hypothetical protein